MLSLLGEFVARLQDGTDLEAVRADLTSTVHRPVTCARITLVRPDAPLTSLAGGREGGPAAPFRPGGS
jgi:hypothetical protein